MVEGDNSVDVIAKAETVLGDQSEETGVVFK